jgi:tetratricopeptide (TPR) repeat protein
MVCVSKQIAIKLVLLIIITGVLSNPVYAATGIEWITKGDLLFSQKDYNGAIKAYDEAISINSSDANAWGKKGIALNELGKYEEAIQACDKSLAVKPNDTDVLFTKGFALGSLGQYESEIQAYNSVIAINPKYQYVWVNKGFALDELGRYYEAIDAYDTAIAINPNDSTAWNNKGLSLIESRRYYEAIQAEDKAIAINPNYSSAWNNKALALFDSGQYYEAMQAGDRARAIDSNKTSTYQNYSTVPRLSPILLLFEIVILAILIRKKIITYSGVMNFIEKVKGILLKPSKTFDAFKDETLARALKYLIIIAVIYSAIFALIGDGGLISAFVSLSFSLVIITFLGGAFSHFFIYTVGGRKGVTQTIKTSIYASTPWLVIGWIPYIGSSIAWLWWLVLMIIGIRQLQEITTGKAVLAIFLPIIILIVLAVLMESYFYIWGWSSN